MEKDPVKEIVKTRAKSFLSKKVREETRLGNLQQSHITYILSFFKDIFKSEGALLAVVWKEDSKTIYVQPYGENNSILSKESFDEAFEKYIPRNTIEKTMPKFLNLDYKLKIVRNITKHIKDVEHLNYKS